VWNIIRRTQVLIKVDKETVKNDENLTGEKKYIKGVKKFSWVSTTFFF